MQKPGQDSNSPVGVLEDYFRTVESDTNSSNDANEAQKNPRTSSGFRGFMGLLRSKSKKQFPALASMNIPKLSGLRSSSMREESPFSLTGKCYFGNAGLHNADSPSRSFTLYELQLATKNFSQGFNN